MRRRTLLGLAAAAAAGARQKTGKADVDTITAGATEDTTPRVAIVLSSFRGSEDHDGTKLKGLAAPVAPTAALGERLLDDMVRKGIELGDTRRGGLGQIIGPDDWVVIKPQITARLTAAGRTVPGSVADPRVVRSLIAWMVERRLGKRITIAEAAAWSGEAPFDPWTSEWDGSYGGVAYRAVVEEFARKAPGVRFELLDLNQGETMSMQAPGETATVYHVAAALLRCDKLITVAPFNTGPGGVVLTLGSYSGFLPSIRYGRLKERAFKPEAPHETLVDVFSFRPADYAILGGEWALEGDGPFGSGAAPVRHNVILAGANPVAVDAVGAAVMGFTPSGIKHLALAARRGFGTTDLDVIWTRGNEIEQARRSFRPPGPPERK